MLLRVNTRSMLQNSKIVKFKKYIICALLCLALIYFGISQFVTNNWLTRGNCAFINRSSNSTNYSTTGIPKILHQTWKTEHVPRDFEKWIKSWWKVSPLWEYWFWTDEDVRCLLKEHYPQYLEMYDDYPAGIFRGDAMRYFILYHYGGIYADLGIEALRSMDYLLDRHSCMLSYETYEHAYFFYNQTVPYIMNAIMACRPQHPFFEELFKALPENAHIKEVLSATGPIFVTRVFSKYNKTRNGTTETDSVSLLHPKYLLPTFDQGRVLTLRQICLLPQERKRKTLCYWRRQTNWVNRPQNVSYTNHHWFHVVNKYSKWSIFNIFNTFDISLMSSKNEDPF